MHPDVEDLRTLLLRHEDQLTSMQATLDEIAAGATPTAMRNAVSGGVRDVLQDPSLADLIYQSITRRARRGLAEYIGERVLMAAAVLIVAAVMAWSVVSGHIK